MMRQFLICITLFAISLSYCKGQSRETLQKHLVSTLSYQQLNHPILRQSYLSIHQIEFKGCTMSYAIVEKKHNNIQRYTVRILLSGISQISRGKNSDGYSVLNFSTARKSIVKEYPDGKLVHLQSQFLPLSAKNREASVYFNKLMQGCKNSLINLQ